MNPRVRFLSRCSVLCVMQAGAKFTHILELTSNRQIFMIFLVDYFCKKGFIKSKIFKFVDNPFKELYIKACKKYNRKPCQNIRTQIDFSSIIFSFHLFLSFQFLKSFLKKVYFLGHSYKHSTEREDLTGGLRYTVKKLNFHIKFTTALKLVILYKCCWYVLPVDTYNLNNYNIIIRSAHTTLYNEHGRGANLPISFALRTRTNIGFEHQKIYETNAL